MLSLLVSINPGKGRFEVSHKNNLILNGSVQRPLAKLDFFHTPEIYDTAWGLDRDDVYRQMEISGFQCDGLARNIDAVNFKGE